MSMTHVLLLRRVVQPGLFCISGNRESNGNEADTSSQYCLFDDMHLPSQKVNLLRDGFRNRHASIQRREGARKLINQR
jgi:hypothetical protein